MSGQTAYERKSGVNPFLKGSVSGSSCGEPELEWLQVDFQDNIDVDGITEATEDIEDILDLKLLEACMEISWQDVIDGNYSRLTSLLYDNLQQLGTRPIETYTLSPLLHYDTAHSSSDAPRIPTSCPGDLASASCSQSSLDPLCSPTVTVPRLTAKRTPPKDSSPALPQFLSSPPAFKSPTRRLMSDLLEAASSPQSSLDPLCSPTVTVSRPTAKRILSKDSSPALPQFLSSPPAFKSPTRRLMSDLLEAASSSQSSLDPLCSPTVTVQGPTAKRICLRHSPPALPKVLSSTPASPTPASPTPASPTPALLGTQPLSNEVDPADSTSDSTYSPSNCTLTSSFPASSNYDKPEEDVLGATRGFLQVLRKLLNERLELLGIRMSVGASKQFKFSVDGIIVCTTPDSLFTFSKNGRIILQIPAECKPRNSNRSIHEIRGQEVCHVLGLAQQMNIISRTRTSYKVFLLSWHHLSAYVSQVNVSKAYLDDLAFESASMDKRLQVLTGPSFNIKIPSERYQLAHLLVQVVRQQLRPFMHK